MCGIFCACNVEVSPTQVDAIKHLLRHRGPDQQGAFQHLNITMIHTRLSIIDLSIEGNQPMKDSTGNVVLVFNGEIYNYLELKREVADYPYRSRSDSEVILACYQKWGDRFVTKLRGMFSLCLYDKIKRKLILAVDRFSIKPLYYYHNGDVLIAASEIKPILLLIRDRAVNTRAFCRFLQFGLLNYDQETLFENIFQLQGGRMLVWGDGQLKEHKFWDLADIESENYSFGETVEGVKAKLEESIILNFRSDVEVGINLSSGLDSNLLLEIARRKVPQARNIRCFTFCFPGTVYDEGPRIDSQRFDLEHVKTVVTPENLITRLESFVGVLEEPSLGLGCLGFFENTRTIGECGIKVVLDGQGADEIFSGYKYYYIEFLRQLYEKNMPQFEGELRAFLRIHKEDESEVEFVEKMLKTRQREVLRAPDGTSLDSNSFLDDDFLEAHGEGFPEFLQPFQEDSVLNRMYIDLKYLKIPKLLRYQDKASMANSVEVRVPYLDHELVELAFQVNASIHLRDGKTKSVLREIYADYQVTDKSSAEQKLYVSSPQREWMKAILIKDVLKYIESSTLARDGIISGKKLRDSYLSYCQSAELGNSFFIWKFLNAEIWYRHFIDGTSGC